MMKDSGLKVLLVSFATLGVAVCTFVLLEILAPWPSSLPKKAERVSPAIENVEKPPPEPVPSVEDQEKAKEEEKERQAVILAVKRPTVTNPPGDSESYKKALRSAEKQGFDGLLETLDDAQLWQIADAARFTDRGELARKALLAIRRRFKDSWRAKVAAFLLGRIAVEVQSDPGQAARWFLIYLREDPKGPLAEDALGRRIYTCREAGFKAESCRVAAKYLGLYPQGSFSEYARSVLRYKPPKKRKEGRR